MHSDICTFNIGVICILFCIFLQFIITWAVSSFVLFYKFVFKIGIDNLWGGGFFVCGGGDFASSWPYLGCKIIWRWQFTVWFNCRYFNNIKINNFKLLWRLCHSFLIWINLSNFQIMLILGVYSFISFQFYYNINLWLIQSLRIQNKIKKITFC